MNAILLISSPDKKGITASVTNFVAEHNGNILHADQHIDERENTFFMRMEWALDDFDLNRDAIAEAFMPIAKKYNMQWNLYFTDEKPNVALFVSKHLHCLYDILYRYKSEQLNCHIPIIISNHMDAKSIADDFAIKFVHTPIDNNKAEVEKQQLKLLAEENVDVVALARYHQILSEDFITHFPQRIINIHHSFLPAFAGKNPYARAYEKGVKIIGATSHYVIEELDQGPIIAQDTTPVSHSESIAELKHKGEDLERVVFARAIRLHLQRKILTYSNKTVIFE